MIYNHNTMVVLRLIKNWIGGFREIVQDILVPEDKRIENLLRIDAGTMRMLLPKSPVYTKDIFVLFDYHNKIVRLMVKLIKYKNNASLRKRVAAYLYEELLEISSDISLFEGAAPILKTALHCNCQIMLKKRLLSVA